MPKKKNKNIMIKIGLFGCQTVGKTCLNSKYCFNKFYEKHNSRIQIGNGSLWSKKYYNKSSC